MDKYRELRIVDVASVETVLEPEIPVLTMDSPADLFMTDFLKIHPLTVPHSTGALDALNLMKESYVRLLLVTDLDRNSFEGVVSASDINGGKVLAYMFASEIHNRDQVLVKHIMTDKQHIHGLDYKQLQTACMGDVMLTIRHLGEQHVLVVEEAQDSLWIRGMYSTTDIAKALKIKFDVEPHAKTFFELEQAITHG